MRRLLPVAFLALSACVAQDLGQSPYLDDPFVATPAQQAAFNSERAEADRLLASQLTDEQARRALLAQSPVSAVFGTDADGNVVLRQQPLQVGTDAALVASLEAAIDSATTDPVELPIEPLSAEADTLVIQPTGDITTAPQIAAVAPSIAVRETQLVQGGEAASGSIAITDNSFGTVSQRETIESDAQRLANLSRERVVLEAEPLPAPTSQANLAAFARQTQHRIGQRVYPRGNSRSTSAAARTCRSYGNSDEAQRAFLAAGGPQDDPMRLDPDGDGFVCGWSPEPFRSLTLGSG